MAQETRSETDYRHVTESAVRSVAAWPRYMRHNNGGASINYTHSSDPIDQEANRKKTERHMRKQDERVLAMGLVDPNYKADSTVSVKGKVIVDHGSEHGVLIEFNDGNRAWIPYKDILET